MSPLPLKFETSFGFQTSHASCKQLVRVELILLQSAVQVVSREFEVGFAVQTEISTLETFRCVG
jgi:hypothetical protein